MNMNGLTDILMGKRPDTKAHILCGSIYYAVREQTKLIYGDGSQMHGYLEGGINWEEGGLKKTRKPSGMLEKNLCLDLGSGYIGCECV